MLVAQLCPTFCGASPGKNTGVGYHALLQGILPTQGCNLVLGIARESFTTELPGKPPCCFVGDLRTVDLLPFSLSLLSLPFCFSLSGSLSFSLSVWVGREVGGEQFPGKNAASPPASAGAYSSFTCAGVTSQKAATV